MRNGFKENRNIIEPAFSEGFIEFGMLYAFDNRISSLCAIKLSDMTMRICARCEMDIPIHVKRIFSLGNLMLMQLHQSASFIAYDRKTREFVHYGIEQQQESLYNVIPMGEKVFLLPLHWDGTLLIFNVRRRRYERIDYGRAVINVGNIILRPFVIGKNIIFPTQQEPAFYYINLDKNIIEKKMLFDDNVEPYIASWDGKCLWFMEEHPRDIYCFYGDRLTGTTIPCGEYGNIVSLSEHVCIMPKGESYLLVIRKSDGAVLSISTAVFENRIESDKRLNIGTRYVYCTEDESHIYFFPNDRRKMFMFDKSDYSTKACAFYCDEYKSIWRELLLGDSGMTYERNQIELREFINML